MGATLIFSDYAAICKCKGINKTSRYVSMMQKSSAWTCAYIFDFRPMLCVAAPLYSA